MTSAINETVPVSPNAFTSDMRANFLAAKTEIEELQSAYATVAATLSALHHAVVTMQSLLDPAAFAEAFAPARLEEDVDRLRVAFEQHRAFPMLRDPDGVVRDLAKLHEEVAALRQIIRSPHVVSALGMRTELADVPR
jgi:hypothetical protein